MAPTIVDLRQDLLHHRTTTRDRGLILELSLGPHEALIRRDRVVVPFLKVPSSEVPVRSTLRHLTTVRGVLAAGVFDERGTRLAVCGRAPALAALTFADAQPSFASGAAPDEYEVPARDDFGGGRVVTYPLESGVLEIVVDVRANQVDPALASHVEAATRALDLVLAPIDEPSLFDPIDGIGTVGCQGPNSETIPCFTRPPGY